jgi:lipid-binding SYLF domain-containing protein
MTNRWLSGALACLLVVVLLPGAVWSDSSEKDEMKAQHKRKETDLMAKDTLERLFGDSDRAKELFDKAYGYAVFSNLKVSLGITGGGGSGVAVQNDTGERTYMNMGTGGLNLGLGAQKYQVVFLFQTKDVFRNFVDKGWKADASANAVLFTEGANVQADFVNGIAMYQLTEGGLMLQADVSGTKYWKNDKLNTYKKEAPKEDDKTDEAGEKETEKAKETDEASSENE